MDPDELIDTLFVRDRPARVLAWILFLYGVGTLFSLMAHHRTAAISADPYTYLQFAQTLAGGNVHLQGPLAEAVQEFHEPIQEGVGVAEAGPIWNTNILPDGRMVYTVAMGYPLFLATVFRVGGAWLYTNVNLLLLGLLLVLLFSSVRLGLGRSLFATVVAACACLFLIRSHPPSFLQFSHPWREPLFYCCIVGAIVCLQLFNRRRLTLLVPLAGFLLGYACATKEPNAIYGMVIGIGFLCSSGFRQSDRKVLLLVLFGVAGVVGVSPILVQNWLSSGNPFRSLQVVRATADFAAGGSGLSPAHVKETLVRYYIMYRYYGLFWWPWMIVASVGAIACFRQPLVRLCVGLIAVHLALYLQWGNADFRHMYFGHIPYAIFLALGVVWMLRKIAQSVPTLNRFEHGLILLPLVALSLWPSPWKDPGEAARSFGYADAQKLVAAIDEQAPENAVLLSNRILRDVLGIYSSLPVARLHDLAQFHPDEDVKPVLTWFREKGYSVLFLDNADKDPRNVGSLDWAVEDREWLHDHHDLEKSFTLSRDEYRLQELIDKPELTAFAVNPWSSIRFAGDLSVPEGGAAFLYVHPRALGSNLQVQVDGVETMSDPPLKVYRPVHQLDLARDSRVIASAGGELIPALDDMRFVSWTEKIKQNCGSDAAPGDDYLFLDPLRDQPRGSYRHLKPPASLRVPVRNKPGLFTTIGLGINVIEGDTNRNVYVDTGFGNKSELNVAGGTAWFPVKVEEVAETWAGSMVVRLSTDADGIFRLNRVHSLVSQSVLAFEFGEETVGALLVGKLTPMQLGQGPHPWTVRVNGAQRRQSRCMDDPRRSLNQFRMAFSRDEARALDVRFDSAGLVDAKWVLVRDEVQIRPRSEYAACIRSGIFPAEGRGEEAFWWTHHETVVAVPVRPEAGQVELTLNAAGAKPGRARTLQVRRGEQMQSIELAYERRDYVMTFDVSHVEQPAMVDLTLQIETWVPARLVPGSGDDRELGFQLYGLDWKPASDHAAVTGDEDG